MKKIFKRLHLWLALPSGLFITLICLTGAIMVFQTSIEELLHNDRYFNKANSELVGLDSIVIRANHQISDDTITALKIYNDPSRNIVATLSSGARVYAYINPSTAKVVEVTNARKGFFHNIMTLHRWLMLPDRVVGRVIIGISTIFMIVILITGLVRLIPTRRDILSNLIQKWSSLTYLRKLLDLHKIIGVFAALILITMSLTGLMWSFDWYRGGVAKILNVEVLDNRSNKPGINKNSTNVQSFWQSAFNQAVEKNPDFNFITITKQGNVSILPQSAPHHMAVDKYKFNAKTGSIKFISKYADGSSSHMMSQNYAIHVGIWGGVTTQILWFIAAIIGAMLPITGYLIYFRCRR